MKKSQEEIDKLKFNLPYGYAEKAQSILTGKGHNYSIETIKKVASGIRENVVIELELTELALDHAKKRDKVKSNIKNLKK